MKELTIQDIETIVHRDETRVMEAKETTGDNHYPAFHLTHCYLCSLLTEALRLNVHEAAKWLTKA